jgi:hypothetical protein
MKRYILVELNFRLHAQYPVVLEFDIYPIDIYRQKTDTDFIGTLNIYQINAYNLTLRSTSSTLVSEITYRTTKREGFIFRQQLLFLREHRPIQKKI